MIKSTTKKSKRPYKNSIINHIAPNFVNIGEEELRETISLLSDNYTASACNFIKKETLAQVFSCEFCLIFKDTFFTKYPRATTSVFIKVISKKRKRNFKSLEEEIKNLKMKFVPTEEISRCNLKLLKMYQIAT